MQVEILKYLAVYSGSMIKFIAGPVLGAASGLPFIATVVFTALGMMTTIIVLTKLSGRRFKVFIVNLFYPDGRLFRKSTRRKVKIWRSYGLKGVAFLTPLLFSPIGGALLAASFGESFKKIFIYMLFSAVFWAFAYSYVLYFLKDLLLEF